MAGTRTMRPRKATSCEGKIRFTTRAQANDKAAQLERADAANMNVYRCRWCGGYHVAHRRTA